jgi:peptidoglycan/xylan/chitin deacetylase (PgdA/CDA1 family)
MDSTRKEIYLVFTGHEFADGGDTILATLKKHSIKASFFFTGDFYRTESFAGLITHLRNDGHYLGGHSDKHLLYASWENRDSMLVTREEFLRDLKANYAAMKHVGIDKNAARYFMPPFEWYNETISAWCRDEGLRLVDFTPGTRSNADYTYPGMGAQYVDSDSIYRSILTYESQRGLNGFILLTHIGTDPRRTDRFYLRLDSLVTELRRRGYSFRAFGKQVGR